MEDWRRLFANYSVSQTPEYLGGGNNASLELLAFAVSFNVSLLWITSTRLYFYAIPALDRTDGKR